MALRSSLLALVLLVACGATVASWTVGGPDVATECPAMPDAPAETESGEEAVCAEDAATTYTAGTPLADETAEVASAEVAVGTPPPER